MFATLVITGISYIILKLREVTMALIMLNAIVTVKGMAIKPFVVFLCPRHYTVNNCNMINYVAFAFLMIWSVDGCMSTEGL